MIEKKKKQHIDSEYTFEPVPKAARRGFWALFFVMVGFTFFSASMTLGASLGNGLDLAGFIWSVAAGGVILAIYASLLGYIGSDTGLSFDLLTRKAFGTRGSYLPSAMIFITQIGWFGVGVAMLSLAAGSILGIDPIILVIVSGVCMTATAYFGIKGMEIISYISVPLIMILGLYSIFKALGGSGGIDALFAGSAGGMSVFTAIGLVIGSFVSGATTLPNFSRFAKDNKSAVVSIAIAFLLGNSLMFIFGAVGGAFTGESDIFYVMIAQGLALPAMLVLGSNVWTTNDNALYSAAMSLANMTRKRKRPLVLICGAIGSFFSLVIYEHFITWLTVLSITLPPIGTVLILDFFTAKSKYKEQGGKERPIDIASLIAVLSGSLLGIFFKLGIESINSMIAAAVVFLLLRRLIK